MKVSKNDAQPPIASAALGRTRKAADQGKDGTASSASRSAGASAVNVSDASRKLAAARAPEVPDEARVEHLRGLLASGQLKVDAGAIADALLREER